MKILRVDIGKALILTVLMGCAGAPSRAPARVPDANFELILREVVGTPEEDSPVYAEVFVDGKPAGRTEPGLRSQEKRWEARLEEGNRLMRFEIRSSSETAGRWPEDLQPRERFIRVEPGLKTKADLKFYDRGRQYDLQVLREPR
jgi:hypothetical protein